jgi:Domain of unknown function (DUF397)
MTTQPNGYSTLYWRKSSASMGAGECVEVAVSDSLVLVRDSRRQAGPVLVLTATQWRGLLRRIHHTA